MVHVSWNYDLVCDARKSLLLALYIGTEVICLSDRNSRDTTPATTWKSYVDSTNKTFVANGARVQNTTIASPLLPDTAAPISMYRLRSGNVCARFDLFRKNLNLSLFYFPTAFSDIM